jgi:hypothetical protein
MSSAGERTAQLKYQCLAADKWSRYPATQDVNMGCNSIVNLQSETFCDGTYIGPGGSFDISSGQDIMIKTTNDLTLESLGPGAPRVLLDAAAGNATMRGNDIAVRLQRYDGAGTVLNTELALSGSGAAEIKAPVTSANPTLKLTNTDTSISASLDYDSVSVNLRAPDVPLYLTKTDALGAAETTIIVSASGNVVIESATPPTLTFNKTSTPATATTVFNGTSLTTNMPSGFNLILDSSTFEMTTNSARLKVSGGAVEGVQIGTDQTINYVAGYGLPLKVARADTDLPTDYIELSLATGGVCKIVQTEEIKLDAPTVTLDTIPLATKPNILYYDTGTKAVTYGANVLPVFVTGATSTTPITLTAADNNKTYVFTSRPSVFQQFNAVGLPLGFSINVRNALGTGALDIDIRKDGGVSLGTLHNRTFLSNASTVPLEVNGTGLIGYF